MWNDRLARRQLVVMGNIEEMDVCLSPREFREFFGSAQSRAATQLLSGAFVLEPWVRVRMGADWMITAGIEVDPRRGWRPNMKTLLMALFLLASLPACIKIPPIIVVPAPPVQPTPAPTPAPAPVPEPTPEPAPEPAPPVEPAPLVNLNIVVHDAVTGAGIPRATCMIGDESRSADGAGFINFTVSGSVLVRCAAGGYQARPEINLPPGDHRFPLAPIAPPTPTPAPPNPAPVPGAPLEACNARNNTGRISDGCLEAVTHGNLDYMSCANGDAVACHRYVRRVAAALRTATGDPGWGLITKFHGQGCTLTACSQGLIPGEQKYGEDMVAYLPKGNPTNLWTGIDVIVGAGAPGARYSGGVLPPPGGGRPDNLWAPVP